MPGTPLFPHHLTPARQERGSGKRRSTGDSCRDNTALVLLGLPLCHTGPTNRVEEKGERKFPVLLPPLPNTHLCRNGAESGPQ